MVVILDLGFGERRHFHHRPHHRFGAAIEQAVAHELHQFPGDLRFRREGHGGVGVVPVAGDPQPLEFLALHVDPMAGEFPALGAEVDDRHRVLILALFPVLLLDLPFDGQTMAVPTRHIVGILAQHLLGAGDDVLQDLVERVADMEMAVGVGRSVVEDELLPALGVGSQSGVDVELLPALENLRLALRQSRPHREVGLRQEDRILVIDAHLM